MQSVEFWRQIQSDNPDVCDRLRRSVDNDPERGHAYSLERVLLDVAQRLDKKGLRLGKLRALKRDLSVWDRGLRSGVDGRRLVDPRSDVHRALARKIKRIRRRKASAERDAEILFVKGAVAHLKRKGLRLLADADRYHYRLSRGAPLPLGFDTKRRTTAVLRGFVLDMNEEVRSLELCAQITALLFPGLIGDPRDENLLKKVQRLVVYAAEYESKEPTYWSLDHTLLKQELKKPPAGSR